MKKEEQEVFEQVAQVPETPEETDISNLNPFERLDNATLGRRPPLEAKESEIITKETRLERRPPLESRPSEYVTEGEYFSPTEFVDESQPIEQFEIDEPTEIRRMTFSNPPRNLYKSICACAWVFCAGFSDGSVGVLLNYIELQYNISYSVASLLWLSNALGFILVAILSSKIQKYLGSKSIVVGTICSTIMYTLVLTGSRYPIIVFGFFWGGIGSGMCIAQFNIFFSSLEKSSKGLGYFHGSYGIGASASPLVATAFVEAGIKWNYFYLIILGGMLVNIGTTYFSFVHGVDQSDIFDSREEAANNYNGNEVVDQIPDVSTGLMKQALKNRTTWITSLFVLFYQGGEVSIGGWITTYLRDYRNHNFSSIGYVASGYWFGLSFGRLILTRPIHKYLGARLGNSILAISAIIFVLITWLIVPLPIEILTITLSGIVIGPVYPLMITYVMLEGLLPRKIQVISLTITTAFGSSGGALFPFLVGLLSQFVGAYVVMPVFIVMFSLTLILWLALPNVRYKRRENRLANMVFRIL